MSIYSMSIKAISPQWPLRIGLGLVYCFSGYSILTNTLAWMGFVPTWFSSMLSPLSLNTFLQAQGGGELLMGLLLLVWFTPRWLVRAVAVAGMIEMIGILVFVGIDMVTFRDMGLLGAMASLYLLSLKKM